MRRHPLDALLAAWAPHAAALSKHPNDSNQKSKLQIAERLKAGTMPAARASVV
eukprot:gene39636-59598_t